MECIFNLYSIGVNPPVLSVELKRKPALRDEGSFKEIEKFIPKHNANVFAYIKK